jgi:hypothetical protein
MKLKDVTDITFNQPDAHLWLKLNGEPTRTYHHSYLGITVTNNKVLLPEYLYYVFVHLYHSKVTTDIPINPQVIGNLSLVQTT